MEGQGKRLLLAVALALGVMLVWNMVFPPKEEPKPPAPTIGSNGVVVAPVAAKSRVGVTGTPSSAEQQPAPKCEPANLLELAYPKKFTARFCSHGGALVSWQLADPRFQKDQTKGDLMAGLPGTGAFYVGFWQPSSHYLVDGAHQEWKGARLSDTQVRYTYESNGIKLEKLFTIDPDAFIVKMDLKMEGAEGTQQLVLTSFAFDDPKAIQEGSSRIEARVWSSSTMKDGEIVHTPLKELKDGENGIEKPRFEQNITWTGFEHPYLLAAYAPKHAGTESFEKHTYPVTPYGLMRTDIVFPAQQLKPGAPATRELVAYLGPKNYNNLDQADEAAGFETGFKKTIDLGWFAFIGRPLLWLLLKFQSVVGNWGIAIILLTFLVKGLTLYWTTKSMRSMKSMAALAPQLKVLQEKYKDDKPRIQAETMALYKQHNVNPIAGCLPILLQMPVWIALYRMLSSAGELYQQPFIPGWIDDLTMTDPYHVLPVVLVATMFVQARLTPATGDSRQQKFLQYGMPLMFGVMSFFFPAGLTLYIFTNTCLSALHSIYMNKYDKKSLEIAARMKKNAEEAAAKTAGGDKKKDEKPAKKVIDAESTERSDKSDDESEAPSAPNRPAQNRPRKKKNRRR
ncbi:MAG: rane protein insertase, YidC/Oxa1 family [Deltaproteobacteria bacterium]|nr:rane protein insertase, YidC/Oxa1 family [Deltaproteobacteria bacterium]